MLIRPVLLAMVALSSSVSITATPVQDTKADRAKAFTIDSITPDAAATPSPTATPTPTPPVSASTDAAPSTSTTAAVSTSPAEAEAALRPSFTLDTPIGVLIADPAARAVLDRDLPGMSTDSNLDKFASLGLRQFQPLTGGQLTDAMLAKVARDLSRLAGPLVAPIAPTKGGTSKRNRDASR